MVITFKVDAFLGRGENARIQSRHNVILTHHPLNRIHVIGQLTLNQLINKAITHLIAQSSNLSINQPINYLII